MDTAGSSIFNLFAWGGRCNFGLHFGVMSDPGLQAKKDGMIYVSCLSIFENWLIGGWFSSANKYQTWIFQEQTKMIIYGFYLTQV